MRLPHREPQQRAEDRLTDITVQLHMQTAKAVLVSDDGDEKRAVWLPKSLCEINVLKGDTVEITLPEWLAKDKGLI